MPSDNNFYFCEPKDTAPFSSIILGRSPCRNELSVKQRVIMMKYKIKAWYIKILCRLEQERIHRMSFM